MHISHEIVGDIISTSEFIDDLKKTHYYLKVQIKNEKGYEEMLKIEVPAGDWKKFAPYSALCDINLYDFKGQKGFAIKQL